MKKTCLTFILLATLGSCTKVELPSADAVEEEEVVNKQQKTIQFVIKGITEEYSTRATLQTEGMTDLWVFEGTTLLKHQVSTDEDFGLPSVVLTYGSHDLTFIASKSTGQSFDNVWMCTKMNETFCTTMNVTVSGGSSTSRQVQLDRRSSKIQFTILDAIPSTVKKMHIVTSNHLSLDASLVGGTATDYDVTVDVSTKAGNTGFKPAVNVLTSSTDEEDMDVMIEFLSADDTPLYHYERTVSVMPNRITILTGNYFAGDGYEVSLNTDWISDLTVDL